MSVNNHNYSDKESLLDTTTQEDLMNSKRVNNNNNQVSSGEPINILCFDISKSSRASQFLILTCATFVFYLLYGYVQELMYKLPDFNKYAWYLTLVQFLFYTIFGFAESNIRNDFKRKYCDVPI